MSSIEETIKEVKANVEGKLRYERALRDKGIIDIAQTDTEMEERVKQEMITRLDEYLTGFNSKGEKLLDANFNELVLDDRTRGKFLLTKHLLKNLNNSG
jgi:hypothetical protein